MVKQEPIVIDSDDDEVAYTAGPSSARTDGGGDYKGKGRASEVKIETNGSGGLDLQARDAIKVALSKLDAEVSRRQLYTDPASCCSCQLMDADGDWWLTSHRSRTSSPN
jgi:hypothetical protein